MKLTCAKCKRNLSNTCVGPPRPWTQQPPAPVRTKGQCEQTPKATNSKSCCHGLEPKWIQPYTNLCRMHAHTHTYIAYRMYSRLTNGTNQAHVTHSTSTRVSDYNHAEPLNDVPTISTCMCNLRDHNLVESPNFVLILRCTHARACANKSAHTHTYTHTATNVLPSSL